MDFLIENIRLRELMAIVDANRAFYDEFVAFLSSHGYAHPVEFVNEDDSRKARNVLLKFLKSTPTASLYDGACKAYPQTKAKWYFLAWLFRDAPAQRLAPLLAQIGGGSGVEKKATLLNNLREHLKGIFPNREQWEWAAISEVLLARLEGSRRALRGSLFEAIVRRCLAALFKKHKLNLRIGEREVRLNEETYDVQVIGRVEKTILIPVKTRETMGGGHALLFTRDIHKSIAVAQAAGIPCLPVVIAESWSGKLDELTCDYFIYIQANPNQVAIIEPRLYIEFESLIEVFREIA